MTRSAPLHSQTATDQAAAEHRPRPQPRTCIVGATDAAPDIIATGRREDEPPRERITSACTVGGDLGNGDPHSASPPFADTEEVTGSNPVAPATVLAGQSAVSYRRVALIAFCGRAAVAELLRELDDYSVGRPHGRMQRLQAITERGVGLRVQVAVAVQRKAD
jgi:hypothetical protein